MDFATRRIFAVIPVKPAEKGKSRLTAVMTEAERADLNRRFLHHALDLTTAVFGAARSIVVSRSEAALDEARSRGMIALAERFGADLNAAVAQGGDEAVSRDADGLLVLPTDLPLASAEGLRRALRQLPEGKVCLIVPDRHSGGTNLLFQSPPLLRAYAFGPGSFGRHVAAAEAQGLCVVRGIDPNFMLDIDDPADLALWRTRAGQKSASST